MMETGTTTTKKFLPPKRRTRFANQSFRRLVKEFNDVGLSFTDDRFKSGDKSVAITSQYRSRLNVGKIVWQRPKELLNASNRSSDDVLSEIRLVSSTDEQCWTGHGPNGWLIAACLSIGQHRSLLKQIVNLEEDSFQKYGIVKFNIWQFGSWHKVVVDDKLPCSDSKLIFSRPSAQSLSFWLPLLEKALAKLYGSYEQLAQRGSLASIWIDLTGGGMVDIVQFSVPDSSDNNSSVRDGTSVTSSTVTSSSLVSYYDQLILKEFASKSLLLLKTKEQTFDPFGLIPSRYYLVKNVKKPMGTLKRTLKRTTGISLTPAGTSSSPCTSPKIDSVTSIQLLNTMVADSDHSSKSSSALVNKSVKLQELWIPVGEIGKHFESMSICRPYQYNKDRIHRQFGSASTSGGSSQFYFDIRYEDEPQSQNPETFASSQAPIELIVCIIQKSVTFVPLGFRLYSIEPNRQYRVHSFESLQLLYSADPVNLRNRVERIRLSGSGWSGSGTCRLLLSPICNHHSTVPLIVQLYSCRGKITTVGQLTQDNPRYDQLFHLLPPKYPLCVSRVVVHGASELTKQDRFGSANPFCIVRCGKEAVKSTFQYETLSPSWNNFAAIFYHKRKIMPIQIELWHRTLLMNHFIGMVKLKPKPIKAAHNTNSSTDKQQQQSQVELGGDQVNDDSGVITPNTDDLKSGLRSLQTEPLTDSKGVAINSGKVCFQLLTYEDLKHF